MFKLFTPSVSRIFPRHLFVRIRAKACMWTSREVSRQVADTDRGNTDKEGGRDDMKESKRAPYPNQFLLLLIIYQGA